MNKAIFFLTIPVLIPTMGFTFISNASDIQNIEYKSNSLTHKAKERIYQINNKKKVSIILIPSYGNDEYINIKGRVLKVGKFSHTNADDSSTKNFLMNIANLSFDVVKGVNVDIKFNNKITKIRTNNKGIFELKIPNVEKPKSGINEVKVEINKYNPKYISNSVIGRVFVNSKYDKTFGVISDIDDTIKKSYVTDKLKAAKALLSLNYLTHERIKGTPELYQVLDRVNDGTIDGDIHYVSGSPIQISSLLENFLNYNKFPIGSIDLKVMGFGVDEDSPLEQLKYKLGKIRNIFQTYPDKKFLLFGDSGEKDPEIYKQILNEYPGRIMGIYINNVTNDNPNSERYTGMLLTNNTFEAANDLYKKGIINKEDYKNIKSLFY